MHATRPINSGALPGCHRAHLPAPAHVQQMTSAPCSTSAIMAARLARRLVAMLDALACPIPLSRPLMLGSCRRNSRSSAASCSHHAASWHLQLTPTCAVPFVLVGVQVKCPGLQFWPLVKCDVISDATTEVRRLYLRCFRLRARLFVMERQAALPCHPYSICAAQVAPRQAVQAKARHRLQPHPCDTSRRRGPLEP
jgi:hypothetical protein